MEHWICPAPLNMATGTVFEILAKHHRASEKEWLSDIFVFTPEDGRLVASIFGMGFIKLTISGMGKLLRRITGAHVSSPPSIAVPVVAKPITPPQTPPDFEVMPKTQSPKLVQQTNSKHTEVQLRGILCAILGLEDGDIKANSDLIDLGVDSLLAMELARDVQRTCNVELDTKALLALTDFRSLVDAVTVRSGAIVAVGDSLAPVEVVDDHTSAAMVDSGLGTPDSKDESPTPQRVAGPHEASRLHLATLIQAFESTKHLTDEHIVANKLDGFSELVLPQQNELVLVHLIDAFEKLGCSLRGAAVGEVVKRPTYLARHEHLVKVFYDLLSAARIIDAKGGEMIRTSVPITQQPSASILEELLQMSPQHGYDHRLTSLCGSELAECLTGKMEAIQLIFGSAENRALVSASYAHSPIHSTMVSQLSRFVQDLFSKIDRSDGRPIKILELGAGTGGTTSSLLPVIAQSGVPVEYTISDVSSGLVAGLRKRFAKQYPFTNFMVIDMEKAPQVELINSQHAIFATNCVHATKDLTITTGNIHSMLRPDGFLVMIEMTKVLPWVDLVFGLTEGWWAFNDGRSHACIIPSRWEDILRANGYGYVDWTEGRLPESAIQQLIIAAASSETYHRVNMPVPSTNPMTDSSARQSAIDRLTEEHIRGFIAPRSFPLRPERHSRSVLVTGATGSLGAHLVAAFATQTSVEKVFCLNRERGSDSYQRQINAIESRGLKLDATARTKLHVLETDAAKRQLGLSTPDYIHLTTCVTDIVHNAWPMSLTRSINGFGNQFKTMRNLIDLARLCRQAGGPQIGFQFVGSIATVGHNVHITGQSRVPEEAMDARRCMPIGYADAKLVCEYMLDRTLRQFPDDFRAMTVRLAQIAGARESGSWNDTEHLAQLFRSSKTLNILPDLPGDLSWCPVTDIAATMQEILLSDANPYQIYHIENPVRQPWAEMLGIIGEALEIPSSNRVPYEEWVARVQGLSPSLASTLNPAARLGAFWINDFIRMSCGASVGGIVLDTAHTSEHSPLFRRLGKVEDDLARRYIESWKLSGFLQI